MAGHWVGNGGGAFNSNPGNNYINDDAQTAATTGAFNLAGIQAKLPIDWAQIAAQMQGQQIAHNTAVDTANIGANASMSNAGTAAGASMYGADAQKQASMYGSDAQKAAALGVAATNADASKYGSDAQKQANMYGSDAQKAASLYGSDAQLKGVQYGADAQKSIAANQIGFKNSVFQQLLPLYNNALSSIDSGGGSLTVSGGGGALPYTDQQVQENVNSQRAQADSANASQKLQARRAMTSGGFGGNSPLYAALTGQMDRSNLANNLDAERETRNNAAVANSGASIQNAQIAEQASAAQAAANAQRYSAHLSYGSQLLAALAGIA